MRKFYESWLNWKRPDWLKRLCGKSEPTSHPIPPWPFRKIVIRIVPQSWMREEYRESYGDYFVDDKGTLQIMVREYENPDFAFGCAVHELLESWRCYRKGIRLEDIEAFDAAHDDHFDPGRLPAAPYHVEHMQSMAIERLMCEQDGYDWDEYDDAEPIGGVKNGTL